MKFITIADIHLSMYANDPVVKGISMRLFYLDKVLREIADYAVEKGINVIAIAGDIFHTKSVIHSIAQTILLRYVRDYQDYVIFYVLDGNHDMSSKSGDGVSALHCLDNEPNVYMMHEPKMVENIFFVPWNAKTMVDTVRNGEAEYLISHFGLNEAQLNSGISIISDIGITDLKHYRTCLLGHYHAPQEIGNVIIPGSIIQLDWGEKHEEKRFLVVDTDKHTIESVPTQGYIEHHALEMTTGNKEDVLELARQLKKDGHYVKINRMTKDVDVTTLQNEFIVVDKVERDITNRGIDSSMSMSDILQRYLEIEEIPVDKRPAYEAMAIKIISDVQEA